jgi:hypothetical protein
VGDSRELDAADGKIGQAVERLVGDRHPTPIAMKGGVVQELNAQATVVDAAGITGGLTTTIARSEIEAATQADEPPQLELDVRRGQDAQRVAISWTRDDLVRLLTAADSDQVLLTFDRAGIEQTLDDVEAHGVRGKAAVVAVAVSAAAGFAGGAAAMPMDQGGGTGTVAAAPAAVPTQGVDPWQVNVVHTTGAPIAAANPKAGEDPWQYNVGSGSDASRAPAANPRAGEDPWQYNVGAAANPKAGEDPWQYNLGTTGEPASPVASPASSDDGTPIAGIAAAGAGAVLLIAGAAFVTTNRRRVPAT